MKEFNLSEFGPILSDKNDGEKIYSRIRDLILKDETVEINLESIKSMATFCAKQIFGRLYVEFGSEIFFGKILLKNASDDLKAIIRIGIQNAIEEKNSGESPNPGY